MIRLIAAADSNDGIANDSGIPWQGLLPTDVKHFRDQTIHGQILMGFNTYTEFDKPLPERDNFVLTRPGTTLRAGFKPVYDLVAFLHDMKNQDLWIIGGAKLFVGTLPFIDELDITKLQTNFHCTKFLPPYRNSFKLAKESEVMNESGINFTFQVWRRK